MFTISAADSPRSKHATIDPTLMVALMTPSHLTHAQSIKTPAKSLAIMLPCATSCRCFRRDPPTSLNEGRGRKMAQGGGARAWTNGDEKRAVVMGDIECHTRNFLAEF